MLTFAPMKLLWKHSSVLRKSIGYALLGLFLWANYGIGYTAIHQHDHTHQHDEDASHEHNSHGEDCLICDFQSLVYTPLIQEFANIEERFYCDIYSIPIHRELYSLFGIYDVYFLRGPPAVV